MSTCRAPVNYHTTDEQPSPLQQSVWAQGLSNFHAITRAATWHTNMLPGLLNAPTYRAILP